MPIPEYTEQIRPRTETKKKQIIQPEIEEEKVQFHPEDFECTICSESLVDEAVKEKMNSVTPKGLLNIPI